MPSSTGAFGFLANKRTAMMFFLSVSVLVLGVDLWTKWYAVEALVAEGNSYPIIDSLFSFTLRYNHGAAFSFLYDAGGWQRWFFAIIAAVMSVVLVVWMSRIAGKKVLEALGLSLILAGALGNLYDRITLGYVVDFIDFYYQQYHFPAFNIADCGITCGAAALIWDSLFGGKSAEQPPETAEQK